MKWQTIIPLHYVPLLDRAPVAFAGNLIFARIPHWLLQDQVAQKVSASEFESIKATYHAFAVEYDAASLGDPDESWKGERSRSKQDTRYELACLANFALWLANPSPASFTYVFDAFEHAGHWMLQRALQYPRLLSLGQEESRLESTDVQRAAALHVALLALGRENSVWTAVRSAWSALSMTGDTRYLLLWVALEALFGPEDAREMTFRLSQRIAFFLGKDKAEAK